MHACMLAQRGTCRPTSWRVTEATSSGSLCEKPSTFSSTPARPSGHICSARSGPLLRSSNVVPK